MKSDLIQFDLINFTLYTIIPRCSPLFSNVTITITFIDLVINLIDEFN